MLEGQHFAPLAHFYAKSGVALPKIDYLDGDSVPSPARSLLVHSSDMTSTLRQFYSAEIGLRVCSVAREEDIVSRLVVLHRRDTGSPVEFGAIRIFLDKLPEKVRSAVKGGEEPLGAILERFAVPYRSAPRAYFSFLADAFVGVLLDQVVDRELYGRCNVLSTPAGEPFAEIVEILPTFEEG